MEKPSNLPNMEIIKDSSRMGKSGQGGRGGPGGPGGGMGLPIGGGDMNMFMPGYVKPTVSRVSERIEFRPSGRVVCKAVETILPQCVPIYRVISWSLDTTG